MSKLRKIDSCCYGVTHAGESMCTTCTLTQQIFEELGGRDGRGSYPRETTLNCLEPKSRSHTSQPTRSKSPAHQIELECVTGKSGQFISIYADAIQHEDLSIPNQVSAIPAQTAFRLPTELIQVLLKRVAVKFSVSCLRPIGNSRRRCERGS